MVSERASMEVSSLGINSSCGAFGVIGEVYSSFICFGQWEGVVVLTFSRVWRKKISKLLIKLLWDLER